MKSARCCWIFTAARAARVARRLRAASSGNGRRGLWPLAKSTEDWTCWRRDETLRTLEQVARRYSGRKVVKGLAVCNEPSRHIPAQVLASFYDQVRLLNGYYIYIYI